MARKKPARKTAAKRKPSRRLVPPPPDPVIETVADDGPLPYGPITAKLMDADEQTVIAEVPIPALVPVLEHDGQQFEPVRPESWGAWIYRQLKK